MGDGTEKNPYTREDVLRLIEENGGKAEGLDLSGKIFEEGVDLRNLNLVGIILKQAFLRDAHLEGAELGVSHLEGAGLIRAHLEGAELWGAYLEGAKLWEADLEGTNLPAAHLEGAKLWEAQFSPNTRLEYVDWGNYILGNEIEGNFKRALDIYRRLKQWYTEHGMYDIAGKFFYREMEAKRKGQSWKKEPASKMWSWVIMLLCGYGERYGNVVVAALVIIFGLAIAYRFGGIDIRHSIYFSLVSFTALGYGSWMPEPAGWIKALGAFESFVGVFMMALFLITFVRKMTR
jgi:hypothetical protein